MTKTSRAQRKRTHTAQVADCARKLCNMMEELAVTPGANAVPTLTGLVAIEASLATARRFAKDARVPDKLRARLRTLLSQAEESVEFLRGARRLVADEADGQMYATIDGVRVPITDLNVESASRGLPVSERVRNTCPQAESSRAIS